MAITIRQLQPTDTQAYRRLRLACLACYPTSFGSSAAEEESQDGPLAFEQHLIAGAAHAFVTGAFADSELVGMCGFVQATRQKVRHQGELRQVCVSPAHAGQGIGRALLTQTIQAAFVRPELEQISLGVIIDSAANALYADLGFQEYGFQKNYLKVSNHYYDHRLMVLFRSDFLATAPREQLN